MQDRIILPSGPLDINGDSKEVSDTRHTFGELYEHRVLLFMALMANNPKISWRAKKHEDGTCFEGSFIAGMDLPQGTISYHIPTGFWGLLDGKGIATLEMAPHWDGYTSYDVLERLEEYVASI